VKEPKTGFIRGIEGVNKSEKKVSESPNLWNVDISSRKPDSGT